MLWGISSLVTLLLNSAVRALPQGDLGDLLQLGPELHEPEPGPVPVPTQATHRTEQVSTLFRIEHTITAFPLLTTHTAQLATTAAGVSSYPNPTSTRSPTSQLPSPTLTPASSNTHTGVISASTSQSTTTSTSYPLGPPVDSGLLQGETVDWRVIGIAVIAVSAVGAMILVIVFFDQWWGFLCDVCGRRRRRQGGGKEELIPDWERRTWEFKVKDNNVPAYPSFGSLPVLQTQNHAQIWQVDVDQRPDQNTSSDWLAFPPAAALNDDGQVLGIQDVPNRPSRRRLRQFSQRGVVDEATTHKSYSSLSRSDTHKSTALEDAYDGLAT
jgi:hypothetical protein